MKTSRQIISAITALTVLSGALLFNPIQPVYAQEEPAEPTNTPTPTETLVPTATQTRTPEPVTAP